MNLATFTPTNLRERKAYFLFCYKSDWKSNRFFFRARLVWDQLPTDWLVASVVYIPKMGKIWKDTGPPSIYSEGSIIEKPSEHPQVCLSVRHIDRINHKQSRSGIEGLLRKIRTSSGHILTMYYQLPYMKSPKTGK